MGWGRFTFIFSAFFLFAVPAFAADRVALVIGNGAYQRVPALPNPPRDAADIAHALERLDFKVTQLNNATASDMRKALVDFGHAAEGSMMAVVFYAGHGIEAGGENWLVPTDAELRSDTDIESEAVSLRSVNLQASKARQLGLIILDACRNNPFAAKMKRSLSTRAVARGLAPTEPTDNVLVAYAARDGTTASDGDGRNSPFTTALLRNIETPGLEISFLFRRVRDDVMAATKREQQPFVYGSLSKEEIYLKAPATSASPPPTINQTAEAPAEDQKFWQAIKTSTVAELYEEFLSRYPTSNHAAEARQRIEDLKSKQVAMSPTTAVSPSDNNTNTANEPKNLAPKSPDRSLFTSEDSRRVDALGTKLQFRMPPFTVGATWDSPISYARFIGVWSSNRGWGNGKGRHGMLIITRVSADGLTRGYYLWGPPTKASWEQSPAGYTQFFTEKIVENAFSFKSGDQTINVKLDKSNAMALSTFKPQKPSEKSSAEFYPIWQPSAPTHETAEPSVDRGRASRKLMETSVTNPSVTHTQEPKLWADQEPGLSIEDSRCNRMHDKLGCHCAVRNGGGISLDGRSWYSKRGGQSALTNEGFVQCQIRAGRR
jgi:Caspase domain